MVFFRMYKKQRFFKNTYFSDMGISAKMSDSPNSKNSGFWRKWPKMVVLKIGRFFGAEKMAEKSGRQK
jgi:hypothetical protein